MPSTDAASHDSDALNRRRQGVRRSWLVRHAKSHVESAPFDATTAQANSLAIALALKALKSTCGLESRSATQAIAVFINGSGCAVGQSADCLRIEVFADPGSIQVVSGPVMHGEGVEPENPT
jgi:hypothetical protein